jgi:hypothetical protein
MEMENKASVTRRINRRAKQWKEGLMSVEYLKANMETYAAKGHTIQAMIDCTIDNKEQTVRCLRRNLNDMRRSPSMADYYRKSIVHCLIDLRNIRAFENMIGAVQ